MLDPATLGAMIPDDEGSMEISTMGQEAPALLRHEPVPPPPSQSPGHLQQQRRVSASAPKAPAAPVQPRKDVARMLPSAHRVYVYKKKDDGKMSFLNEYSAQELQGVGTIEAFIKKYIVAEYGYGEFHVHYYDGQQKEPQPLGAVTIDAPASVQTSMATVHQFPRQESKTESLKELLEFQKVMATQQQPQKSPAEQAMETMVARMIEKQMSAITDPPKPGEAPKSSGDGMVMMMLLMQMQQKPAPVDNGMTRMMEKMIERIERMEEEARMQSMMVPPPPPPPPPPHGSDGPSPMEMMLETMKENTRMMVEAMKAQHASPRDPIKDLADMATLMAPRNNEALTTKDIFTLLPQFRDMLAPPGASKDPFEKTIENFRLFKMMQREFGEGDSRSQQAPGESAETFWSFAKGLVQSDIGKSIAGQILQQGAGQQIATQPGRRAMTAQEQAQNVANRRAHEAGRQRQLAESRAHQLAANASRAQEEANRVQAEATQEASQSRQESIRQATHPVPVAAARPPEPPKEEDEDGEVNVPEGFLAVHAPAINGAPTDAERIGAIITGFQLLATSTDFRPVISKMFGLCKQNRRLEALDHLKEILEFFSENEVLDKEIPQKAAEDFDRHWAIIRSRLEFPDVPEVFPEGHPQAVAAAPQAVPAP
jgi:hypothetical protein